MAEIVRMPKLSDTMTDGVISKWHKKLGDKVKSGELLADIETDKATMEFESFQDGILLHIGIQEKQSVPVDSIIAILGKEGEDITKLINNSSETDKKESGNKETNKKVTTDNTILPLPLGIEIVRMPKLSDTMTEGVLSKWHKKVGDKVKNGELLADIQTDKATMEFESFQDGVLIYQGIEEGKTTPIDAIIAILGKGGENIESILNSLNSEITIKKINEKVSSVKSSNPLITKAVSNNTSLTSDNRIKASPLAKLLAKERGINLNSIKAISENGRITKKDIENYKSINTNNFNGKESFIDEPISQMRKIIAKRLLESKNGAPHFYLNIEVDMDNAISSRNAINSIADSKISFNDLIIKACAMSLKKHPKVNTSWMGDTIRSYSHIHIGVAVAIEDGLLVPIVRFADQKSFSQISAEVKDLSKRAKDKKLQPSDWEGNTFTVSNLGMFGIESFTSIINSPESCILSVGTIRQVPVVKNNLVVPGNLMKLTLACDHRTVDGATGAAFLQTLKGFIENPITLLL